MVAGRVHDRLRSPVQSFKVAALDAQNKLHALKRMAAG